MIMFLIAQSALQTDWSGGPGVCGVVPSWGNTFCSASADMFYLFVGKLRLRGVFRTLNEHNVDNSIGGWDNDPDIVDLDIDGDNDLLVSDESGPNVVYWYENTGCGDFTRYTIDPDICSVDEVVAADYQGDGDMDVFAASHPCSGKDVVLYRNDGGMSFTINVIDPAIASSSEGEGIDAGDLDNDGDIDIAVSWLAGGLYWYENLGASWSKHPIASSGLGTSWDVLIDDYDLDGDNDIALATRNALRIFRNDGGGIFTQIIVDNTLSDGYGLAKGDMDNDGDIDLILTDRSGKVFLYRNDGGLVFTRMVVDNSAARPMGVQVADFEPDGDLDIAVADQNAQRIYIYLNDGFLNFFRTIPSIPNRHYFGVGIGDLNSDASPDILVRAGTTSGKEGLWWYQTVLLYAPYATLTSSIYDAGFQRRWTQVRVQYANCNPPASGKRIELYVRVSRDNISWTSWIGPYVFTGSGVQNLYQPSIIGSDTFVVQNFRYLQYRVELYASSDSTLSPILDEIEFIYDPLGGDDELSVYEIVGNYVKFNAKGEVLILSPDGRYVYKGYGNGSVKLRKGIYMLIIKGHGKTVKKKLIIR